MEIIELTLETLDKKKANRSTLVEDIQKVLEKTKEKVEKLESKWVKSIDDSQEEISVKWISNLSVLINCDIMITGIPQFQQFWFPQFSI